MLKSNQQVFYDEDEAYNYDHTPADMINSDFFNDDIYDYKEKFLNGKRGVGVGDLAEDEVYDVDDQNDIEFAHMGDEFIDDDDNTATGQETFFKRVDSMEFVKKKQAKIIDKYLMGELLGDGSYGKVKECLDMENLARRAVKIINLKMVSRKIPKGVENVRKEIKIMKKLNHKNTIKLYSTFEKGSLFSKDKKSDTIQNQDQLLKSTAQMINLEKPPKLYIFMDYCITSLEKLLKTAPLQRLTNFQANYYFKQLIDGLEYLHSLNIIHNDIKPGNLLVTCDDVLKICDFSISADLGLFCEEEYAKSKLETKSEQEENEENFDGINPNLLSSSGTGKFPIQQCTPMFQCPEMLDENIDELFILRNATKIDIWSSGITLYQLATGSLPFQGQTLHQIFELIRSDCEIKIPSLCDKNLCALLKGMLNRDMVNRWSIDQIRESEWFRKKHALIVEEMAPLPLDVQQNELGSFRMINYLQNYCQSNVESNEANLGSDKFYSTEEELGRNQAEPVEPAKTHFNQATKVKKSNCLIM